MYAISAETIIDGDLDAVWAIATDVDRWASWDPHEQEARIDGAFAAGTTGWSKPRGGPGTIWTLTAVTHGRSWTSTCGLPGGGLSGENTFEPLPDGRIRCTRTVRVTGPLTPLFRLWFGPRIRRDMFVTWAALERTATLAVG